MSDTGRSSSTPTVRVGVAGWSYPDWRGVFYPSPAPRKFSELRYAAERFDCLEINSTFYRLPEARLCESWARQVEDLPDFQFTAKLFRELTHGARDGRKRDDRSTRELCQRYAEGLQPLIDARRLGAVLVQFPWYFEDTEPNRHHLSVLAESLTCRGPLPLVVELRHHSFLSSGAAGALPFLEGLGFDFANIDLPRSQTSPPPTCINTGRIGYFRLHGRNRAAWFDPAAGRDQKYDYLYSIDELTGLTRVIRRVAAATNTTYVITNNHFRGQAPANAFQIIELLHGRRSAVPEPLQREFPFLVATG